MPKATLNRNSSGPRAPVRSEPYPSPKPKSNDTSILTEKSAASLNAAAKEPSPASQSNAKSFLDLELLGECDHSVPVYDNCTIVRTKLSKLINQNNQKPENTIPGEFLKNGSPKYWSVRAFVDALGDGVSEKMYRGFVRKSGLMTGAESEVFYRAYCFLEKKRIWEGKPKSSARKKVEIEYVVLSTLSFMQFFFRQDPFS